MMMRCLTLAKEIVHHPANKSKGINAIGRAFTWQAYKLLSAKPKTTDFHGLKFLAFPDSTAASSVIYFNSLPDYEEMLFIKRHLKSGNHFIDIGANIGIYTLLAASLVGETGSIEAFEANPITAARLQQQVDQNNLNNIHVHHFAVADRDDEIEIDLTDNDCTTHIAASNSSQSKKLNVKAITLDRYLPDKNYSMGKMDIEGAEILALKGAEKLLSTANPPIWQLELAGYSKRYGYRSDQVIDYLKEFNYHCAVYHSLEDKLEYLEKPWELGVKNILAIHESLSI